MGPDVNQRRVVLGAEEGDVRVGGESPQGKAETDNEQSDEKARIGSQRGRRIKEYATSRRDEQAGNSGGTVPWRVIRRDHRPPVECGGPCHARRGAVGTRPPP